MNIDRVRATYESIRGQVGPQVTIVAATKYVSLEDMAMVVEAGIEVVGENRAQDLERKHATYADVFPLADAHALEMRYEDDLIRSF